jgi:DNA polymerase-4
MYHLPIEELYGIGKSSSKKLRELNINTIGDLARADVDYIVKYLGKWGEVLWRYANGEDNSPVLKEDENEDIKSVGNSITCYRDLTDEEDVKIMLSSLCDSVSERVRKYSVGKASALSISIRDGNLNWFTRQAKLDRPSVLADDFLQKAMELFRLNFRWESSIRSLGVSVFDFILEEQISLNTRSEEYDKKLKLLQTVGDIKQKYGNDIMRRGIAYKDKRLTKEGEGHGSSLPNSHGEPKN